MTNHKIDEPRPEKPLRNLKNCKEYLASNPKGRVYCSECLTGFMGDGTCPKGGDITTRKVVGCGFWKMHPDLTCLKRSRQLLDV